ncbi:unnamed protein product [Hydatigera taeniaeformis]|uniref:GAE domain-containing protein n=1 Tax=Hydatigena taeniaeformis TaxID=6205 RepID=A0A0R3WNK4_HYDTA|nr:unnamed protein product [Hydatigera taeniaeformis]
MLFSSPAAPTKVNALHLKTPFNSRVESNKVGNSIVALAVHVECCDVDTFLGIQNNAPHLETPSNSLVESSKDNFPSLPMYFNKPMAQNEEDVPHHKPHFNSHVVPIEVTYFLIIANDSIVYDDLETDLNFQDNRLNLRTLFNRLLVAIKGNPPSLRLHFNKPVAQIEVIHFVVDVTDLTKSGLYEASFHILRSISTTSKTVPTSWQFYSR